MPSNASRMATHSETRTLRPGTFRAAVLLATHMHSGWGCSLTRTKYTGSPTVTGSMGFCGSVYNLYAILEIWGGFPQTPTHHTPNLPSFRECDSLLSSRFSIKTRRWIAAKTPRWICPVPVGLFLFLFVLVRWCSGGVFVAGSPVTKPRAHDSRSGVGGEASFRDFVDAISPPFLTTSLPRARFFPQSPFICRLLLSQAWEDGLESRPRAMNGGRTTALCDRGLSVPSRGIPHSRLEALFFFSTPRHAPHFAPHHTSGQRLTGGQT